ncbi:MAG: hypothetical protein U1E73_08255 [Planctomycetota bacterium]
MNAKAKLMSVVAAAALSSLFGCHNSDGAAGQSAYQIAVANGFTGTEAEWLASLDPNNPLNHAADVGPEQCSVCHSGFARNGESHQAIYDDYVDTSIEATITGVSSVDNGNGTWTVTLNFSITQDGSPLTDANGLPSFEQKRFYVVTYDSVTRTYSDATDFSFNSNNVVSNGGGTYTVVVTNAPYAPEATNAQAYLYLAKGLLDSGSSYSLYSDVTNAALAFGNAASYVSTANVSACERCHGAPYRKHGYRMAHVANIGDFSACKVCHLDDKAGGHEDWQLLVDDPATYAAFRTTAQGGGPSIRTQILANSSMAALYAYKRTVMADVHMSHAMEFAYPQNMANCATCHEGHLTEITDPSKMVAGTCKSCHPVTGVGGTDPHRAPSLSAIWADAGVTAAHAPLDLTDNDLDCSGCHNGSIAPTFATFHPGYDPLIYESDGTKYADNITASIGTVTRAGNVLTIPFTVNGSTASYDSVNAVPMVMVSFFGYDTKDFIVSNHSRDANSLRMEFVLGTADNALFTTVDGDGSDHTYSVTLDFGAFSATPSIPDMIASGVIRRAQIAVLPKVTHATLDAPIALDAVSQVFDLESATADPTFYEPIVDVAKCNKCHDALGTTFHTADRGGDVTVCRMCHVGTSGGSHLELQSRSIDSYVHAIHSFQLFDPGDIDYNDPVAALEAEEHVAHQFPNFTRLNCEACHVDATSTRVPYNVPDQSKSMPGVLSGTDAVPGRNIGSIPAQVTGPGARACGACHRADFINADDVGGLVAFMRHTKTNGYAVENDPGVFNIVFYTIMSYFY